MQRTKERWVSSINQAYWQMICVYEPVSCNHWPLFLNLFIVNSKTGRIPQHKTNHISHSFLNQIVLQLQKLWHNLHIYVFIAWTVSSVSTLGCLSIYNSGLWAISTVFFLSLSVFSSFKSRSFPVNQENLKDKFGESERLTQGGEGGKKKGSCNSGNRKWVGHTARRKTGTKLWQVKVQYTCTPE